jgi:hypothetical protein
MTFFVVDVESDGPAPGLFSMVSFGVVRVDRALRTSFRGELRPISERWNPEALAISGVTREQHLGYAEPATVMLAFRQWLQDACEGAKPVFISDNPAFDWSFVNYYLHAFTPDNPFGHSARRIGDLYGGIMQGLRAGSAWRERIRTKATHDPVIDATGNAEAFLSLIDEFGLLRTEPGIRTDLHLARAAGLEVADPAAVMVPEAEQRLLQFAALVRQQTLAASAAEAQHNFQMRVALHHAAKLLNSSESLDGLAGRLLRAAERNLLPAAG